MTDKNLHHILVGLDFSDSSLNCLNTAVMLADKMKSKLSILYVRDTLLQFANIDVLPGNSVEINASSVLSAIQYDIHKQTNIEPNILEEDGIVLQVILKKALELRTSLIVMGTHGASGKRNGYVGSTAHNVVKYAPCPVLLVPEGKKWKGFHKPLIPVRPIFTAFRHYDIFRDFIAPEGKLEILGLAIPNDSKNSDNLTELVESTEDQLARDRFNVNAQWSSESSIAQNILAHAENIGADLIVISPSIDVTRNQFHVGPNAHHLINHANVPILIINRVNIYVVDGSPFVL